MLAEPSPPRRDPAALVVAWGPVVLLAAAAIAPDLRIPALVVVGTGAALALARPGGRPPAGVAAAYPALLPVAISLAFGLWADPAVATPGGCDDLLAPPVVRRVVQAIIVLGFVALLATRLGGLAALGIRLPPDRRVTVLAVAGPLIVTPVALVVGPPLAEPFFGTVDIRVPTLAALLPATLMAVSNAALEEVVYRGTIQRWGIPAFGRAGAIAAQAVIFGSAHLGGDVTGGAALIWLGMVAAGIAAGVIADRTRSLLLPFTIHAAVDVPLALAKTCRFA